MKSPRHVPVLLEEVLEYLNVRPGGVICDATLGLAFAKTGVLYPFFGTLIGWLGTASTGSWA